MYRQSKNLPPEKLYDILRRIFPKRITDEKYTELTGFEPPESEEDEIGLGGLEPPKEET